MTLCYYNGQFTDKSQIALSPDDRGFLFGDGVYEVIRAYQGRLLRGDAHFQRLQRCLDALRIQAPDLSHLKKQALALLKSNELDQTDTALYIQITRGASPRQHAFPGPEVPPTVYMTAYPIQRPLDKMKNGVGIILYPDIRWARCDIKSISLIPNVLALQEARESNAEEAVFVKDGMVTEGSHTAFCAVFEGQVHAHPEGKHILGSITREIIQELCQNLKIPFRQRPIPQEEIFHAQELMILGTTTEIMPVIRVNGQAAGGGHPGPLTCQLQHSFYQLVRTL